ncbi:Ldh family oxidoreductase [Pelagicoccus mobilis]|uniref:Ldh family oxidoreductase n=1 Tax=Pelagicoccus mobilis TaxID=415221 RepID=A0A934RU78_9BACT|nr:Ldh family oxidoreductase [Pelagicoccus mobilis]MBK1876491.1 Ldh family oxidoreductase [Pelagicoccus mobilis]
MASNSEREELIDVSSIHIQSDELRSWGISCLEAMGVPSAHAEIIIEGLVNTSLWGIDSHGIARLPHYLNRLEAGSLNPSPEVNIESTGPCSSNVNGDHGLGIYVMHRAAEEAIQVAQTNGIGIVGVRESSHCGAIGLYGRMIAEQGLLAIVFTHSDSFVAPHNGYKKFLGTNPICIATPNKNGPPVCLDMATSAIPFNYIMNARNEDREIPSNVAYGMDGDETTNPHEVTSLRPMAEHKGYALAMMIDLICGPLNGMPFGLHIPQMYNDLEHKRHLGSFLMAIDPNRFFGGESFSTSVASMANEARQQPSKRPEEPVLAPGDDQYASKKKRLETGIPVEAGLAAQMKEWSAKLAVELPAGIAGK